MKIQLHPAYLDSLDEWNTIDDFLDGSTKRVSKYLIPHASESAQTDGADKAWTSRLRRFENENEIQPIINVHVAFLAQEMNIGPAAKDPRMEAILADVDGFGTSARQSFKKALKHYLAHGKVGILVDAPEVSSENRQDDANPAFRSYHRIFTAQEILGWSHFKTGARRGRLASLIISLGMDINEKGEPFERLAYYFFDRGADKDAGMPFLLAMLKRSKNDKDSNGELDLELLDFQKGSLPEIPFELIGSGLDDSILRAPVQHSRKLMNQISSKENVEYHNGFQRLVAVGAKAEELQYLGESTIANIANPDAKIFPIEAGSTDSLRSTINEGRQRINRAGMRQFGHIVSEGSAQVMSADSKALDMKALEEWFNEVLDLFSTSHTRVYRRHAVFEGVKPEDVSVTFGRDFGIKDPASENAKVSATFAQAGQLGAKAVQKQILKKGIANLGELIPDEGDQTGEKTRARLLKAVDDIPDEDPSFDGVTAAGRRERFSGFN